MSIFFRVVERGGAGFIDMDLVLSEKGIGARHLSGGQKETNKLLQQ